MKLFLLIAFSSLLFGLSAFAQGGENVEPIATEISYSELRDLIGAGEIAEASISDSGWWVTVVTVEGSKHYALVTPYTQIADRLVDAGVETRFLASGADDEESRLPAWLSVVFNLLPFAIFLVFLWFIMFVIRGANKKIFAKNDDHLTRAEQINNEFLTRSEKLQNDFFDRLEKILVEQKGQNG